MISISNEPDQTMWPIEYVRELIKINQPQLTQHVTESWNNANIYGSSSWYESVTSYDSSVFRCFRTRIDSNTVTASGDGIVITFKNESNSDYIVEKVTIAEIDPSDAEGNVIDSTWKKSNIRRAGRG